MRKALVFLSLGIALSGCGQQIGDFVRSGDGRPKVPGEPVANPIAVTNAPVVRTSGGAGAMIGTQVQGTARVARSGASVTGTQVQGRVSISQNRTQ